jgi:hypothetical protein
VLVRDLDGAVAATLDVNTRPRRQLVGNVSDQIFGATHLLKIPLDGVPVAEVCVLRVLPGLAERPSLAQQIPTAIELERDLFESLAIGGDDVVIGCVALLTLVQQSLLLDERLDVIGEEPVVDPEMIHAQPRKVQSLSTAQFTNLVRPTLGFGAPTSGSSTIALPVDLNTSRIAVPTHRPVRATNIIERSEIHSNAIRAQHQAPQPPQTAPFPSPDDMSQALGLRTSKTAPAP